MCVQLSIYHLDHFIQYQMKFLLLVSLAHWNKILLVLIKTLCIHQNCVCVGCYIEQRQGCELCKQATQEFGICAFFRM